MAAVCLGMPHIVLIVHSVCAVRSGGCISPSEFVGADDLITVLISRAWHGLCRQCRLSFDGRAAGPPVRPDQLQHASEDARLHYTGIQPGNELNDTLLKTLCDGWKERRSEDQLHPHQG
eukprot:scaffold179273_cov35-Prasinocladus_malaysianus.AAC.1